VWPLLMAADQQLTNEIGLYQPAWGILYLLAVLAIVQMALRRTGRGWRGLSAPNPAAARILAWFLVVSFVVWMVRFSIQRYLVALELLAPLALWLLARRALPAAPAEKWAAGLIAVCAVAGCLTAKTWGHDDWDYTVDVPPMKQPQTATVLVVGEELHQIPWINKWGQPTALTVGGEPQAWRIPFLPEEAAYIGIATAFPSSPGYEERARKMVAERGGAIYALFPGAQDGAPCQCSLLPSQEGTDNQNRALLDGAETKLRVRGWQLQRESCTVHASYIGRSNLPFHWGEVTPLP